MATPCILLTGAAGALGTDVAAGLTSAGMPVIALLHKARTLESNYGQSLGLGDPLPTMPASGEIGYVVGDITQPELGLDRATYKLLARSVDLIVHAAAVTDFGRPDQIYYDINLRGTQHVLQFAQTRPAEPIPLVHLSSVVVSGDRDGRIAENDLNHGQEFANAYERSKCEAEELVRAARCAGVPVSIVRPSIIVGDERTGQIRDFQNIYVVLKVMTDGHIRTIPGQYGAVIDLVPVDYVVAVVMEAVKRFSDAEGKTFHAVNGHALTLRDISDVLAEYPPFHAPRIVPPQNFDAAVLPAIERRYYSTIVSLYDPYFRRRVTFDNTATVALLDRSPPNSTKPFFRRLLDYALRTGYLGSAQPGPAAVLAELTAHSDRRPASGKADSKRRRESSCS